jgi:hypothetical protein
LFSTRKEGAADDAEHGRDGLLPLRILELRPQIAELSGTIRQLQRSGLDDAAPHLLISRTSSKILHAERTHMQKKAERCPTNRLEGTATRPTIRHGSRRSPM